MYLLTWLILPMMMSYVDSGAFAFRDRLRDAAWSNVQFYGATGAVGMLIVGYIALTRGVFGADLVALLMALANFWGLFLVIAFMGFGLVAIPRKLWRRSDLVRELSQIESCAVAYKDQAYDAGLELADVAAEIRAVSERVSSADDLRMCVDRVLKYCPDSTRVAQGFAPPRIPAEITEAYLAKLHNRIKHAVLKEERDRWRWNQAAHRAFFLQDTLMSRENPSRLLVSTLRPWSQWSLVRRSAMWWWYIVLRPFVFRALAIITAVLSIAILWSELTFNTAYLSAVRYVLRALGLSYFGIEAASIVVITYMCVCAYSSVMKLRIFNIYSLESHHHTNERSLLFCGAYLCRLMFPLCYNFLGMAGSTSAGDVTEFAKFMDQIDLVPILGEQSNRVIPVLVMIPATLAFFNIHGRVMDYFSIDSISSSPAEDDPELGPLCLPYEEGRALLLEARRAAEQTQGAVAARSLRCYSPPSSVYTNSGNFRSTVPDVGPTSDQHTSTCGPREWHLGRPSLDHLRQTTAFGPVAESPSLPVQNEPRLFGPSALHKFGSSNDLYGSSTNLAAQSTDGEAASSDSSDLDITNPQTSSAVKPTGMAARFVYSLHPNKRASKLRSKVPSGWPSNFSRLRPSSRQSSLHYPAGGDGMLPPQMPTSSNLKQPLLYSPSSPGRATNPWAEPSAQMRRHALSDSSIRSPKHVE
ncbi:hypothetical protein IWW36_001003 [Coemansia brasiliensis]|uniref:LMBR1-like membrane protein n=1 Tax=Coemansia brasiliensis TaxID=2650707 RepID=A0A9W8M2C9_9FUNG|nr:hypothetical protein IWW36_001003 [Coemansia brasiliensis]